MNIVFMGTPDFSVPILDKLVSEGYHISLVVTQPDRPKGRKQVLTPPPVKVAAEKHGIPIFQPEKIKQEDQWKKIKHYNPDIIVTAAFGQILPKGLLQLPPLGCVNVHASLLPKYRGGAPIHQAIIDGEKETGITIMYMVEKLDAGDILAQRAIPIGEKDTTGTMHDKLSTLGAELLLETLPKLQQGTIEPIEQDESKVTYAPNITKEKEKINWNKTAREIYNHIRGLVPWPVSYTTFNGIRIKIWWGEVVEKTTNELPGTITELENDGICVACGENTVLKITELQPAGKKKMAAKTFLLGAGKDWTTGMKLGD